MQLGSRVEQALEVVAQRHEGPLQAHFCLASQAEHPKAHRGFDDPKHRFDCLLALRVECFACFGVELVLHLFLVRGRFARSRWIIALLKLRYAAAVSVPLGCHEYFGALERALTVALHGFDGGLNVVAVGDGLPRGGGAWALGLGVSCRWLAASRRVL